MDLAIRWHRLLRALAFLAGGLVFSVAIIFIFSNLAPVDVHWRIPATVGYSYDLTLQGVNTWLLAIVPLLVGALVGYFYQTPARMHHVRDALRHRHRVHEVEHELRDVRNHLDKLLGMPQDGGLAVPATLLEHRELEPDGDDEPDPRLPDEPAVALLGAGPSAKSAPGVIRATSVGRPRRNGKAANGKNVAPQAAAAKPVRPVRSARGKEARKSS